MRTLLLVGAGSFAGGILRYVLSQFVQVNTGGKFPAGTLAVNLLGCFAIGVLFALAGRLQWPLEWRLFLLTGICGGFTTFSAFGLETVQLLQSQQTNYAGAYVLASVILGIAATWGGMVVAK